MDKIAPESASEFSERRFEVVSEYGALKFSCIVEIRKENRALIERVHFGNSFAVGFADCGEVAFAGVLGRENVQERGERGCGITGIFDVADRIFYAVRRHLRSERVFGHIDARFRIAIGFTGRDGKHGGRQIARPVERKRYILFFRKHALIAYGIVAYRRFEKRQPFETAPRHRIDDAVRDPFDEACGRKRHFARVFGVHATRRSG